MKLLRQLECSLLQKCTAVVFVLLMAGFGIVQAVHVHDALGGQSSSPAPHCSLCMVAHNAALVTPTNAAPAPLISQAITVTLEPQLHSQRKTGPSFIRPPPQSL